MLKCKFCDKECKNDNSHRNHQRLCPDNPNRIYKNGMTGKSAWNKGLTKETDDRVLKNSISVSVSTKGKTGRRWTDEQKRAKSEWRKKLHKEFPETHPNRRLAGNRSKMSYPERVAYDWLVENEIEFEHQKQVDRYYPDFVVGNTIIEIDGEYWHNAELDEKKDLIFKSLGYDVIRIKAKELIVNRLKNIFGV